MTDTQVSVESGVFSWGFRRKLKMQPSSGSRWCFCKYWVNIFPKLESCQKYPCSPGSWLLHTSSAKIIKAYMIMLIMIYHQRKKKKLEVDGTINVLFFRTCQLYYYLEDDTRYFILNISSVFKSTVRTQKHYFKTPKDEYSKDNI